MTDSEPTKTEAEQTKTTKTTKTAAARLDRFFSRAIFAAALATGAAWKAFEFVVLQRWADAEAFFIAFLCLLPVWVFWNRIEKASDEIDDALEDATDGEV